MKMPMPMADMNSFTLSYRSIFRVVLVLLGLVVLYVIREVLGLLFVSVIFAAAINPSVTWLQSKKIPRGLAILIIYLILFAVIGVTVASLIPPLREQLFQIRSNFPILFESLAGSTELSTQASSGVVSAVQQSLLGAEGTLGRLSGGLFGTVSTVGERALSFLGLLALIYYMTVSENGMERVLSAVVLPKHRAYAIQLFERIQDKIGLWLRAQAFLMIVVGTLTYIGLKLIGVKYALLLAMVAGLTEVIPFIGPIMGAIPAVFVAFNTSITKALLVVALYFFVQWFENNILVPKVMKRAVGLNPVVVIAAILIGAKLGGVLGAIIAVPVAAAIAVAVSDLFDVQAFEERILNHQSASKKEQ